MATLHITKASNMQCGDKILQNNKVLEIQSIDGPDHTGTYDLHVKDENGRDRFVIVQDLVTIIV
jgi:hypothetical protein